MDGFSNYSVQMFFLAKRCVMRKTQVHILKVKVTIWGQRQRKSCPEHIFYSTSTRITKHGVWVHLRMAKCWILFKGLRDLTFDLNYQKLLLFHFPMFFQLGSSNMCEYVRHWSNVTYYFRVIVFWPLLFRHNIALGAFVTLLWPCSCLHIFTEWVLLENCLK